MVSKGLKLTCAIGETLLGIPVLGGLIVMGLLWIPLGIMFILHLITLIICSREGESKVGNIVGVAGNLLAWIPILGMLIHIATAIVCWIEFKDM